MNWMVEVIAVLAGIAAWLRSEARLNDSKAKHIQSEESRTELRIKIAQLETRMDHKDQQLDEISKKIDKLIERWVR